MIGIPPSPQCGGGRVDKPRYTTPEDYLAMRKRLWTAEYYAAHHAEFASRSKQYSAAHRDKLRSYAKKAYQKRKANAAQRRERVEKIKSGHDGQANRILDYMRTHDGITPVEAIRDLGVMRLASRIVDIRHAGYTIEKTMETAINRYGEATRYARYRLIEEKESNDE